MTKREKIYMCRQAKKLYKELKRNLIPSITSFVHRIPE